MVKNIGCPSRGPGFDFQHPHDSPGVSVMPVPGDLMPSSDLYLVLHAHGAHTFIYVEHSHTKTENTKCVYFHNCTIDSQMAL